MLEDIETATLGNADMVRHAQAALPHLQAIISSGASNAAHLASAALGAGGMVAPPPDASASDGSNRGGGVSKEEMRIPKTIRKRSLASKPMFRRCPRKRKRPRKHPKRSQSQEAATQVSETTESEETEETELEQEAATQASGSQVTVTEETESNPSAWMNRKGSAYRARFELFGHRIMCCGELAVVKSYDGDALYGVVFDSKPEVVLREELLRPGRNDWKRIEWEGDIVQTAQLRPLCPKCGICLGVGANAWSLCDGCGHRHPGCASTQLLSRTRYGGTDPFRRPAPEGGYAEGDDDDSDDSESDDVISEYSEGDGGESDGDGSDSSDDSADSNGKRHRTLEDIVRSQMEKHMPASLKKMRKMS